MSKLNDIIFIDSYPKLDIHGYDRETARVAINDFIEDSMKMCNSIIIIIHGIGEGILKETTHLTLKKNKNVLEYKTYYFNEGSTVVLLK